MRRRPRLIPSLLVAAGAAFFVGGASSHTPTYNFTSWDSGVRFAGHMHAETVTGSPYADELSGRGGPDVLRGSSGDDVLIGGDGNDVLIGGPGYDTCYGGAGADDYQCEDNE